MAKRVPFIVASPLGDTLLAGLQKVLSASGAQVELAKAGVKNVTAADSHVMAGPLPAAAAAEVADRLSLSTRVTSSNAAKWYPGTIYPKLSAMSFRNLYNEVNPSFSERAAPAINAAVVPHDSNELSLMELKKEATRTINNFFTNEARESIQDTLRVACAAAIANKSGDRAIITVVHKPQGDLATSTFDEMLKAVAKAEAEQRADEFRTNSVSVEVTAIGAAWPKLVMFPDNVGCVVCAPTAHGQQMETLLVGLGGGSGMVAQQLAGAKGGSTVYTCANAEGDDNPTGAILSAVEMLNSMGMKENASKILAALEKTYTVDKVIPAKVPSGSASADQFIEAVCKNCA